MPIRSAGLKRNPQPGVLEKRIRLVSMCVPALHTSPSTPRAVEPFRALGSSQAGADKTRPIHLVPWNISRHRVARNSQSTTMRMSPAVWDRPPCMIQYSEGVGGPGSSFSLPLALTVCYTGIDMYVQYHDNPCCCC